MPDCTAKVRVTGPPGAAERTLAILRRADEVEQVTTRGPYQRNDGQVSFYAELTYAPATESSAR